MAELKDYLDNDLTLRALSDKLIEQSKQKPRSYLGMSEIGEECWRMLWYRFRNVLSEPLRLNSYLAIEDGYKQEDIMVDRLRMLDFIKLENINPETNEQFEFSLIGGHFCGHCDGKISGILEAPKTEHIWENKAVNQKKFDKLKKIISDEGEKKALALWDGSYYAQAVIYMEMSGLKRHYLTVETPGGRDYTSCRTEENPKFALSLKAKAETIITSEKPLVRLSENRSFYLCNWCRMKEVCFDNKIPQVNCRTCALSEPQITGKNGQWKCYKKDKNFIGQGEVCESHLFLNTLVPFKTIDADQSGGTPTWIKYGLPSGESFINTNKDAKIKGLTSSEMYEKEFFELCFSKVDNDSFKKIQDGKETTKKLKGLI
jgi:hypothetical protein